MAKKIFTDESLATFVDEVKAYADSAVSTKADSSHNHAASNITSGTLSSDRLPTVPITKGGTGATTAAAALTNLGITATAAELNKLDGVTATTAELNYVDGVTSNIQTQLDGKAASSHGTHVSYSTTAPVMDGTASVGTASTVARSDHKHPTDTSRASKTEFDSHTADTTAHMTSTQKTQLSTAYNHSQAAHAPSNAQANQNAFSNIKVGSTTIAADTTTDTLELAGSNVTITPDATNDKVTISVADGTTSAKGVVQLTDSTSSTSTTTAATPKNVKAAYDAATAAQSRADAAYTLADGKVDSLSDLGITASATELNYVDGVTSAIQTQLDGKVDSTYANSNYASKSLYDTRTINVGRKSGGNTGSYSLAFGSDVEASANFTQAFGANSVASGFGAHAEGTNYRENNSVLSARTVTIGDETHTVNGTTAKGRASHAEGVQTFALGYASHSEGYTTTAGGEASHAEGYNSMASGNWSHAEGEDTVASGIHTHAEGYGTIASSVQQHVQGKYNIEDASGEYLHIVGNGGSDSARSNAHTLDWDGNAWFAGDVYVGGTGQDDGTALVKSSEIDSKVNEAVQQITPESIGAASLEEFNAQKEAYLTKDIWIKEKSVGFSLKGVSGDTMRYPVILHIASQGGNMGFVQFSANSQTGAPIGSTYMYYGSFTISSFKYQTEGDTTKYVLETTSSSNWGRVSVTVHRSMTLSDLGNTTLSSGTAMTQLQGVTPASIGAAASSHNHSASNITSGTLPVARGGTGATSVADALKVLCSNGTANTAPAYVMGFNSGYASSGYTTMANLRKAMGVTADPALAVGSGVAIGATLAGKQLYTKVFNFGTLPNNTEKSIAISVGNARILNVYLVGIGSTSANLRILPQAAASNDIVSVRCNAGTLFVKTTSNWSEYSAYAVVTYTADNWR